jgi:hypothetical protein
MTDARASRLLIQLAIVSPDEVAKHMTGLITKASPDQLRQFKSIRRDLVGALEKLVWHSTTFEVAADTLLRLALSENETWSNNATGTWLGLFSPLLPATAAKPAQRMAYLERVSTHSDPEVRLITAKGAHAAIGVRGGAVMVSGELQGGVVVEPRGTPQTYDELWAYLRSGILLLQAMVGDPDRVIRATAEQALIDSIHPMLEIEAVRDTLFDALTMLPEDAMRKVRTQIRHLEALFRNVEKADFKSATDSEPDVEGRRAGLAILQARLPEPAPVDELTSLAFAQRWEWEEGELQTTISEVAFSLPKQEAIALITVLLSGAEPPEASFELGVTLYSMAAGDETAASLAELAETSNVAGLVGYLHASATDGHSDVFDVFLDGPVGSQLDPATRLVVTVRGPQSPAGWSRLLSLTKVLPVQVAAPRLFGWHRDVPESHLTAILDAWLTKVESQADYNFAIDVVAMIVSQRPEVSPEVEARISALVELRSRFPEVGQQSWDWAQMARRQLATDANALLPTLLTQVDAGWLHLYEGSDEKQLIQDTIAAAGVGSLDQVLGLVQAGSWRLQMDFRGWLADSYPAEDVVAWVSRDIGRARLVASLTQVAGEHPSTVVRYLLDEFGSDEEVSSSLYGDFTSGAWWGKESERLDGQISQLEGWAATPGELPGVRSWAVALIEPLMRRRASVLEAEAEGRQ